MLEAKIEEKKGFGDVLTLEPKTRSGDSQAELQARVRAKFEENTQKRLANIKAIQAEREAKFEVKKQEMIDRATPKSEDYTANPEAVTEEQTGLSLEEIAEIRIKDPKRYAEMIQDGKLKNIGNGNVELIDHRGVKTMVDVEKVEEFKKTEAKKYKISEDEKEKQKVADKKYYEETNRRRGVVPEVSIK